MGMKMDDMNLVLKYDGKEIDIVKEKWIDIAVVTAIASHELLWDELNQLYYDNELACVKAYQESTYYERPVYQTHTAEIKDMIIKTISIYAWRGESEEFLLQFIKKGYKRYYDYVESNPIVDWNVFMRYMLEREADESEVRRRNVAMVVLYLTMKRRVASNPSSVAIIRETVLNMVQDYLIIPNGDKEFYKRVEQFSKKGLQQLTDVFGFKISREINLDALFQKHENILINRIPKTTIRKPDVNVFDVLYAMGLYRYYKPLTTMIRNERYNDMNFIANTVITREELLTIHGIFEVSKEAGRLKDEEYEVFLVAAMMILMLIKHYRGLSEFYAEKTKKEQELLIKNEQVKAEEKRVKEEKNSSEEEIKRLKKLLDEKDERINQLEKQLKNKEVEIGNNEHEKRELQALRDYVFRHENEQEIIEDIAIEFDANELKEKKIAIIGGHQRWQNKIKQAIPNVRTVHPDEIGIDLSFIRNMDIVCFETSYNNHSIYQRTIKELEHSKTKLHYLNSQINTNRLMRELTEVLSS